MKLFVGLDVSSFDIKACFLNEEGDQLKTFTVDNDLPGATKLRDEILHTVQGESVHELRIGLESTSVYSFHPSMFLHNDEFIQALGGQVFVMNPKQIANFKKSYSDMDKSIERIMKGVPQTLQTIPGVGPVFTAGIIAEIGQIERFENEAKITKYAGLYWRKHQSGRFTAEDTSLSRNGNQYLRYYLVEAANSVRRQIPEYSDYSTIFRYLPSYRIGGFNKVISEKADT